MKKIIVDGITVYYNLTNLVRKIKSIKYDRENYINNHRTSGGKGELHEDSPSEDEFNLLKENFINDVLNIEANLSDLIRENLFLTKKGALAKNRRRPILSYNDNFYVNVIDEYDHDLQFDRPYLKLERIDDTSGELTIAIMQTNY